MRAAALRGAKVSFSSTPSSLPQILPITRAPCILFDSSDSVECEISFTTAPSFLGWGMCGIDAEISAGLLGYKCSSSKSMVHTSDYWAAFFFILLADYFFVVANECYYVFVVNR